MNSSRHNVPEFGPFQFVILVLSIFVLAALAVDLLSEWLFAVPTEVQRLLRWIDNSVCVVFLADFVIRFRAAESKWRFMRWGWIDLLASIPEIELLRFGRLFRVFRLLRLVRAIRSWRAFFRIVYASRAQGGAASVVMITFLVLSLASIGILLVESAPRSNIRTAGDALWWSVTTITTVGYGDHFPVTAAGRFIAAGLMFMGVGLFGTFSGLVATLLLGGNKQSTEQPEAAEAKSRAASESP